MKTLTSSCPCGFKIWVNFVLISFWCSSCPGIPFSCFGGFFESKLLGSFGLDQNVQEHLRIIPTKRFGQIQLEHKNPHIWGKLRKPRPLWWILRSWEFEWVLGVDAFRISSQHPLEPPCKVWAQSELIWISYEFLKKIPAGWFILDRSSLMVRYALTCLLFSTLCFELSFGGDLSLRCFELVSKIF